MIKDLFHTNRPTYSLEVFPPKKDADVSVIYDALDEFKTLHPSFISVTYGAGGGKNNNETFKIAQTIRSYGIESAAHLPCIGLTKEDVLSKLRELETAGIENILALRGDIPDGGYVKGDFKYASDLISFI